VSAPHVLVARQDSAGDVLLLGPAIRAIAAGARRVTLLCGPLGESAARLLPGVDEVVVHRSAWIDAYPEPVSRGGELRLVDRLGGLDVDQAIIFTSFHQSPLPLALLLRFAGISPTGAISVDYPGSLLDVRHQVPDDIHEVERSLSLAARMGFELPAGDDGRLQVNTSVGARRRRAAGFGEQEYIVVHPGASVPARAWGPAHHAELVGALIARGHRVMLTGGPDERILTAMVASSSGASRSERLLDLGGRTTLAELAELLAGAEAVVVGNTGPAHLAAAVGTPVVSLFAPTVPAVRWRPWSVPHVLLGEQDIACAGCRARECPLEGHPCLSSVSVAEVVDATEALAGRAARAAEREAQVEAELRSALERQGQVA
jgi:ADP-heptose:LPS heptosyltransferase